METTATASATSPDKRFIRVLPFYTKPIVGDPELEIPAPVALWKSGKNICEDGRPDSRCDDGEGLYYTIVGGAAYHCPRHWYEMHNGPDAPARLIDMRPEQYERERRDQRERLLRDRAGTDERI